MRQLKFHNAILCDFASVGEGNKHTLVNVYSGSDVIVSELPASVMFATYLELVAPQDGDLTVRFTFQLDSEAIASVELKASLLIKGSIGVVMLPSFPMNLPHEGELRVIAEADGYARTTAISKTVRAAGALPA